ncbi:hypothetical protein [Streptomyces turgidiscabies]|uniref:hypothetical protein n=1 Tax=Streptomyces turgidiscabies TaxID=85558 RepID=UPI0038F5FBD8
MTFQPGERFSAEAAVDLSAKQYHFVKLDSNGKLVLASAATDNILGVLANAPKLGQIGDVVLLNGAGSFKVKTAAANIAKDAYITSDANGQAVATTTTGNRVAGRLPYASTASEIAEYIKHNEKY